MPNTSLKIAHVDTGTSFRGGQTTLLSLAQGLDRRGHHQLIVCPVGSPLGDRADAVGLEVTALAGWPAGGLRRLLSEGAFDIVHAHDAGAQTMSFLGSVGLATRRVASRQVAFPPRNPTLHRLKYTLTCHGVIAISESVRQVLVSAGVPCSKIEVIVPGIEIPQQLPGPEVRARARAVWGFSEHEFVIGHLGAFTPEKGQDVALVAASILASRLPRARMLLFGDGPMRSEPDILEKVRQASGVAQLGSYVDDLEEFYAGLDLFIMPSRSEGWGLAALGAMAHGIPVVASDVGGLPEMIEHGKSGWLVAAGSPDALAKAIEAAQADPVRLWEFGQNARARAEKFSLEHTVDQTEAFYRRLLSPTDLDRL